MDKKASPVNRIISRYREEPARLNIRVTAIYLYGSYARDNNREGSDIDLVVVSPDFTGFNMRERLELLGLAAARRELTLMWQMITVRRSVSLVVELFLQAQAMILTHHLQRLNQQKPLLCPVQA